MLGRDRGAPDDEEVDAGVDHGLGERLGVLRRERARDGTPASRISCTRLPISSGLIGSA